MKYIYGIDIGGTTIKMGLFAEDGTLKEKGVYGEVDYDVNAKDGFYYGLGLGVEYKGFIADLSYQVNYSDIEDRNNSYLNSSKADFQRVTLGLGYNFGF